MAVFTDPGLPSKAHEERFRNNSKMIIPTTEHPRGNGHRYTAFTVNSAGGSRFCRKCNFPKPDRTHHCSTCKRCVLKMDHHCPWLATCVGMYNYKAFLLFLIYTSMYCWFCFAVAMLWLFNELGQSADSFSLPVNIALLATLGGVFGLVLTGFTAWHISLAVRGMTTIENLEKTRYVSPLHKARDEQLESQQQHDGVDAHVLADNVGHRIHYYGNRIMDAAQHANVPGTRKEGKYDEEDEEDHEMNTFPPSAPSSSYADLERRRDAHRYQDYLDEQDNERMPSAFNLGWRRNLRHLFGDRPLLWFLPVQTTTGDGWHWEPSRKFLQAREDLRVERENHHLVCEREYYYRERSYVPPPPTQPPLVSRIPPVQQQNGSNGSNYHSGGLDDDYDYDSAEDNPLLNRGEKGLHKD